MHLYTQHMCPLPLTIKGKKSATFYVLINKNEWAVSKIMWRFKETWIANIILKRKKKGGECQKDSTEVEVPIFVCIQFGSAALSVSLNTWRSLNIKLGITPEHYWLCLSTPASRIKEKKRKKENTSRFQNKYRVVISNVVTKGTDI